MKMTLDEREQQRISFAYGNLKADGVEVSRDFISAIARKAPPDVLSGEIEYELASQKYMVCLNHSDPLFHDGQHKCRQAFVGYCMTCADIKDLNSFFRCSYCGEMPPKDTVRQKYSMDELLAEEATRKPLTTKGLTVGQRILSLGKRLLPILLRPVRLRPASRA